MMKSFLSNMMNDVLDEIELGRIGWHQVKMYLYRRFDGIVGKQLRQKPLHLRFVRGIAVKKNV